MQILLFPSHCLFRSSPFSLFTTSSSFLLFAHFVRVSAKNVTLGVPRLVELINVAKETRTPGMTVRLPTSTGSDFDSAKAVLRTLEHTTILKTMQRTEIYYDPEITTTVIEEDRDIVELFYGFGGVVRSTFRLPFFFFSSPSPFCSFPHPSCVVDMSVGEFASTLPLGPAHGV